ncbi:MAG TPA: UDP-3-O-(3-hydroxymyristoyl)glucosamine N-acyltransferase [Polyangiaceae bacterium]|nr:UDP-3-O-(3-hydroxymyristoyl)glucosamine N-acyltransferase [Polyangiaceae bacterium]
MASEDWGVALAAPIGMAELVREHGGVSDEGVGSRFVRRLVPAEHATRADDLAVVTSVRWAAAAAASPAVILCQSDVASRCPRGRRWVHAHAMYVVAHLMTPDATAGGIDPRARVEEGAVIDPSATIGPGAAVLSGARVGAHSVVGDGAILYGGVRVGARVTIGPLAVIGRPGFGWATGPRGDVVRIPQRGGVVIEDDVEVGALSTVDAGTLGPTILRRGVKLDAHVHVGHNVSVGEHTYVAAQSGFAGSARIAARVLVGGQVGVTDHAVVGQGARIAAKSGVIGDVAPGAVVAGFPAVPKASWLRAWAKLLGGQKRRTR